MFKIIITSILLSLIVFAKAEETNEEVTSRIAYEELGTIDTGFIFSDPQTTDFEILYFFSYACPACYRFHENLEEWKTVNLTDNISFREVPVVFRDHWEAMSKLHFIGNLLNVDTTSVYDYHHEEENFVVSNEGIINYFENIHNMSSREINPYLRSNQINMVVQQAMDLADKFEIPATPYFIIIDSDYKIYRASHRISNTDVGLLLSLTYLTKPELRSFLENPEQ